MQACELCLTAGGNSQPPAGTSPASHAALAPLLLQDIPDAKESGLSHLCEFIEDCEFTYLSTQILHVLGGWQGLGPGVMGSGRDGKEAQLTRASMPSTSDPSAPTPHRQGGPPHARALQVHPLHLQPHHPGERHRARGGRVLARRVRPGRARAAATRGRAAAARAAGQRRRGGRLFVAWASAGILGWAPTGLPAWCRLVSLPLLASRPSLACVCERSMLRSMVSRSPHSPSPTHCLTPQTRARCLQVRDRATLYLAQLGGSVGAGAAAAALGRGPVADLSLAGLERALTDYLAAPGGTERPFDLVRGWGRGCGDGGGGALALQGRGVAWQGLCRPLPWPLKTPTASMAPAQSVVPKRAAEPRPAQGKGGLPTPTSAATNASSGGAGPQSAVRQATKEEYVELLRSIP